MRNQLIVKVLAILIANLFLSGAMVSANPKIDEVASNSAQTHDTFTFSYYENQISEDRLASADRKVEITVKDTSNENKTVPGFNVTVYWKTGVGTWFGGNVLAGILIGAIVVGLIVGIFTLGIGLAAATLIGSTVTLPMTAIVGVGAASGAVAGGISAYNNKNVGGTVEYLFTDANGKATTTKSWQDDVSILIDMGSESEISGYAGFKPMGEPQWIPKSDDTNKQTRNYMSVDLMLVKSGGAGSLLGNMKIAQNKVGNLTYAETDDMGNYDSSDPNVQAIDMHNLANADYYGDLLNHDDFKETNFWQSRINVYPDGQGSDIIWMESKRLIYVKDASGITSIEMNASYFDGNGVEITVGAPAGAFTLDETSNDLVPLANFATGKYIFYQWIWVVGTADLTEPYVNINAFIRTNLVPSGIEAGSDKVTIPDTQHIITFTSTDTSLISNVKHTVYAERSIPTVTAQIQYNFYGIGNAVRVKAISIQSLPDIWSTQYGDVELTYDTCNYSMQFQVENNAGLVVYKTIPKTVNFNYDTMVITTDDVVLSNISNEQSYKLTFYNKHFGAGMSSTLFYQLTDWDGHQNISVELEKVLNQTFTLTGNGEYGNFNNYAVNSIFAKLNAMDDMIDLLDQRIKDFIQNNYTKMCQDRIAKFKFFLGEMNIYRSKTASDIVADATQFADFRALCYASLFTFNHAYLYMSCSIAYDNGDLELVTDLVSMMAYEDHLIDSYYAAKRGGNHLDLTLLIMLLISGIVGGIVTYVVYRAYMRSFHKNDNKRLAMILAAVFIASFLTTFLILWFWFYPVLYQYFGQL